MSSRGALEWLLKEISDTKSQTKFAKNYDSWLDSYCLSSEADLAVHKEKLKELHSCMKDALSSTRSSGGSIILLTGPTGCGKTTAVRLLSRSLPRKANVVEFVDAGIGYDEYTELEKFVSSSGFYGGRPVLFLDSEASPECTSYGTVMILENLPVCIGENPARFHNLLRLHSARARVNCLLVLILSSSNSTQSDLTCERIICPLTLCNELRIRRVEFNPIAPTIIIKALNKIGNLQAQQLGLKLPSRQLLQSIANDCSGDIRSAVNQLQFQLMSGNKKNQKESDLLSSHRDGALSLFRTLGKILYCKRLGISKGEVLCNAGGKEGRLPPHLEIWRRPPLDFDLEEVLDLCHTDGGHIVSWLHENYPDFAPNMTAFDLVSQEFSWTDAFLTGGMNWQLGLTPASDSFVSRKSNRPYNIGSKHYPALVASRTVLLADDVKDESGAEFCRKIKTFRSFRSPFTLNTWKLCKEKFDTLEGLFLSSNSLYPIWLAEHLIANRIVMILDYLPVMWKVLGESWFSQFGSFETITSLCTFCKDGYSSSSSKVPHFTKNNRDNSNNHIKKSVYTKNLDILEANNDWLCPPDAAVEGNHFNIDENFSDEENQS